MSGIPTNKHITLTSINMIQQTPSKLSSQIPKNLMSWYSGGSQLKGFLKLNTWSSALPPLSSNMFYSICMFRHLERIWLHTYIKLHKMFWVFHVYLCAFKKKKTLPKLLTKLTWHVEPQILNPVTPLLEKVKCTNIDQQWATLSPGCFNYPPPLKAGSTFFEPSPI